jgi:competence protein ComEA
MPSHRLDSEPEQVSLRRLTRVLGSGVTGWTPPQPATADGDLSGRSRMLIAPHLSALTWLVLAGLAVLVVSGFLLSRHHGGAVVDHAPPAGVPAPTAAPVVASVPAGIVADVGGRVRHPGLVTLPAGARVADAIAAAGGALRPADLERVDLAAHVVDGQLLLIGVPGGTATAAGGAGGGPAVPVDLNTATVEQLDALPGVGPVLAQRILDWRQAHGGFRSIDDLQQVPGIGARKFSDLKALVTA